ncbi:MAG: class I SAM-dependent methyltransferase [Phycisphaerales bacterium]|nr:class I SAM-dependent methyltransferase [Phycisphaerales bacterium]
MMTRTRTNRPAARQQYIGVILGVLALCVAVGELHAKTPTAAEFPGLIANFKPFDTYVCGNSISVDGTVVFDSDASKKACSLLGVEARILSFEENKQFLCLTAQSPKSSKFVRRVILIKPSILIVDDVASGGALRWRLSSRKAATCANGQLLFAGENEKLVCSTLWPAKAAPSWTVAKQGKQCSVEIKPTGEDKAVRCLNVLSVSATQAKAAPIPIKTTITNKGGVIKLTVTVKDNTYRFELPAPGTDAGTIEVASADDKLAIQPRPLPAGVLPHGPEGMKMIERWDRSYRKGKRIPWNNDLPAAPVLQEAVKTKTIKPCRTVVLGCGSGSNAIFLAKKGFDVTAVDVAPSALGIAMANAKKAGVKVRWVLSDVLKLPDLKQYDLIFDRGCYHHVRYVDPAGFAASLRQLMRPGARCFILSCNRDKAPGIREKMIRDDFSEQFDFEWLRKVKIHVGKDGKHKIDAWSVMLRQKGKKKES